MTSAIRAVIADDEALTRERVRALATACGLEVVGEARNGLEALDLIASTAPDLIFIDVEMPELNGLGVVAALEPDVVPVVVFITAFEQYALKAFDVGAIDYLHKPVTRSRFEASVARARERITQRTAAERESLVEGAAAMERERGFRSRFVVRRGNSHHFVSANEIDWIDAADNYLQLHSAKRVHLWRGTMKQAEDELDPAQFMRVHRSAIVAVDRIQSVATADGALVLTLRDESTVRVSRQYTERIKALLASRS